MAKSGKLVILFSGGPPPFCFTQNFDIFKNFRCGVNMINWTKVRLSFVIIFFAILIVSLRSSANEEKYDMGSGLDFCYLLGKQRKIGVKLLNTN